MYKINQIKLNINQGMDKLYEKVAKFLHLRLEDIDFSNMKILHKSIDARDKSNICFVYNVAVELSDAAVKKIGKKVSLEKYEPVVFNPIVESVARKTRDYGNEIGNDENVAGNINRPVVVGLGPAGLFAAYVFALNGLKPIVIERGKAIDDRIKDTEKFFETMELDEESNVCFGEGGAGAFSDGKLNTNNKDREGLYKYVLETFVKFGANEKILYENLPHIGTDKLTNVIKNLRNEIIKLGGEIHYSSKLVFKNGVASVVKTDKDKSQIDGYMLSSKGSMNTNIKSALKDSPIVLAIGNSARDTFRELIDAGFDIKAKTIAVGYRIAHKQSLINTIQYGAKPLTKFAATEEKSEVTAEISSKVAEILGPATYKLVYNSKDGRAVYSFCMCPGGYIINSSNKKGELAINGMSYNDRGGKYANSAIVTTVNIDDIDEQGNALKMIEFQEKVETKAFLLEKGFIPYITSDRKEIANDDVFKGLARYSEKLLSVYENCGLKFDVNATIFEALKYFNKNMNGFYNIDENSEKSPNEKQSNFILAGVETRTSSPVALNRDENYMCNVKNYYPCGEGLGHGGGIMSSAVDGIKVAFSIVNTIYSGIYPKKP